MREALYLLVYLRRSGLERPVDVHLRHGGLESAPRTAREAHVQVAHGRGRQRLAVLNEERVGRVFFDGGRVRVRLPDCVMWKIIQIREEG